MLSHVQVLEQNLSIAITFLSRPCPGGVNAATGFAEQVLLQEQPTCKSEAQFW